MRLTIVAADRIVGKGTMSTGQDRKLSASLEDYLEAIFNLADDSGGARSKDIADRSRRGAGRP